ncbi:MAG: hypothetical protein ACLFUV_02800 [Methanomassiliicoccales archaeon]
MKFCYCPECDRLRLKNWYSGCYCESCNGECRIITVSRTVYGYLMYLLSLIALAFIVLYLGVSDLGWEVAALEGMSTVWIALTIFGMLGGAMVLAYIDIGRTTRKVEEILLNERVNE